MTAGKDTFYVSTPIYYANDVPHIGHAYTTVAADVVARWRRLNGDRVFFLTGTDEHGQKVAQAAADRGVDPQRHVDEINPRWHEMNELLRISNDDFIRTTEPRHTTRVQEFMQRLYDQGDLYTATYAGPYCVRCEAYYTPEELLDGDDASGDGPTSSSAAVGDGLCPIHRRPVERLEQENWFFRLSKYGDRLLALYDERPDFVRPAVRLNEVRSFVAAGLEDISASRSAFDWGVAVPWQPGHVFYVWFDALLNYITAVGYGDGGDEFDRRWPADVQLIGKDILRFHAVYWPAMLMAAGVEVPQQVFAHGFLLVGGEKMGKSNATGIAPAELVDHFGRDCYRYYFLREISFGHDGTFSWESMADRYTADLANDLGNLANRVLTMVGSYCDGVVPEPAGEPGEPEARLAKDLATATAGMQALDRLDFSGALADLWTFVSGVNRYVEARAPWAQRKAGDSDGLHTTLYTCVDALRVIAVLISPVMPDAAEALWAMLGSDEGLDAQRFPAAAAQGGLPVGASTTRGPLLFPRLDDD
ncbi:methionine--tRNA ligase [soil metagenome]